MPPPEGADLQGRCLVVVVSMPDTAVSIQLLAAPFKPPDAWRSQLASVPLFICRYLSNQTKKQVLGTSAEDQEYSSGVTCQSYTVQQWSPIFMASYSNAEG